MSKIFDNIKVSDNIKKEVREVSNFLDAVDRKYSNIYSLNHKIQMSIYEMEFMLKTGLGKTNKPIPEKRIEKIKKQLEIGKKCLFLKDKI